MGEIQFVLRCTLVLGVICGAIVSAWAAPVDVVFTLPNFTSQPGNVDDSEQDQIIYQDDYVTTESVDSGTQQQKQEDKAVSALAERLSIGIDTTIIEDQQLIAIPFGYRIAPNLKVGAAIPFVRRTGNDGSTFGIGDVSASLGYRWGSPLR